MKHKGGEFTFVKGFLYAKTMCSMFTDPPWEARAEGIKKYQIYITLGFLTPQSKAFCEQCLVVQAVTRTPGRACWLWRGPVGAVCTAFIGEASKWNGMERQICQFGDGSQCQRAAEWLILPLHENPHLIETDSGIDLWQLTTAPVSLGPLAWAASSLPLVSSDWQLGSTLQGYPWCRAWHGLCCGYDTI